MSQSSLGSRARLGSRAGTLGARAGIVPTLTLADAKLRLSTLPAPIRSTAYAAIDRLGGVSSLGTKKSGTIDEAAFKRIESAARKALERFNKDILSKESVLSESQKASGVTDIAQRNYEVTLARLEGFREKLPRERWAEFGLDDIEAKARSVAKIPELPKGQKFAESGGEYLKSVEQKFGEFGRVAGQALPSVPGTGGFLGEQAGYIAATPVSVIEGVEFFRDPEYRAQVNPQGTTPQDYIGAAAKLWLNVGAPGSGKLLGAAGQAVGRGVGKAQIGLASKGNPLALKIEDFKEWWGGPGKVEFGKSLVENGVDSKTAARTSFEVSQLMRAASPEDIDLAFSRVQREQLALPGKVDDTLALPAPQRASGTDFIARAERAAGPEEVGEKIDLVGMAKRVSLTDFIKQNWKVNQELFESDLRTVKRNTPGRKKAIELANELKRATEKGRVHPLTREALEEEYKANLPKPSGETKIPSAGQRPYRLPSNVQEVPPGGFVTESEFKVGETQPLTTLEEWQRRQRAKQPEPTFGDDLGRDPKFTRPDDVAETVEGVAGAVKPTGAARPAKPKPGGASGDLVLDRMQSIKNMGRAARKTAAEILEGRQAVTKTKEEIQASAEEVASTLDRKNLAKFKNNGLEAEDVFAIRSFVDDASERLVSLSRQAEEARISVDPADARRLSDLERQIDQVTQAITEAWDVLVPGANKAGRTLWAFGNKPTKMFDGERIVKIAESKAGRALTESEKGKVAKATAKGQDAVDNAVVDEVLKDVSADNLVGTKKSFDDALKRWRNGGCG